MSGVSTAQTINNRAEAIVAQWFWLTGSAKVQQSQRLRLIEMTRRPGLIF
jgi:hypothetical protein